MFGLHGGAALENPLECSCAQQAGYSCPCTIPIESTGPSHTFVEIGDRLILSHGLREVWNLRWY